jgi:hypothetical protein
MMIGKGYHEKPLLPPGKMDGMVFGNRKMEKGTRVTPELLGRFSNDAITVKLAEALSWLVNLRFSGTRERDVTAGEHLTVDPVSGLVGGSGVLGVGLVCDEAWRLGG